MDYISTYEPLNWLVAVLFAKEWSSRTGLISPYPGQPADKLTILLMGDSWVEPRFKNYNEFYAGVDDFLNNNADALAFYEDALKAVDDGYPTIFQVEPDEWGDKPVSFNDGNINSYEFLLWAEKRGKKIPAYVLEKCEMLAHDYISHKRAKEAYATLFPQITVEKFQELTKEPLWRVSTGILYLLLHRSRSGADQEKDFFSNNNIATKLAKYAVDAFEGGKLNIKVSTAESVPFNEMVLAGKIEPSELIRWSKTLPLQLPTQTSAKEVSTESDIDLVGYTTPEILMIKAVMEHFWSDHQAWGAEAYSKSETADAIQSWIFSQAENFGIQKMSKNIAQAIQIIARPVAARGSGRK